MELRKGYKQTEVGVIPIDWEVKAIEDLTPRNRKYCIVDGPFGSNLKTIHYRKSGIPIITSGYVTDGKFFADKYLYVDIEKFKQEKRSAVTGGDIVMAKIGERCGASAILPLDHEQSILSGNALKITIDEEKNVTNLIWQILWDYHCRGNFELLKTTGAQPALSMANLKKFKLPLPSAKSEQTAIATALSDVDAFISCLEKIIEKKRNIKQSLIKQLLVGKKRLDGFKGNWIEKPFPQVCWYQEGPGLRNWQFTSEGIKVINVTNLVDGYLNLERTARYISWIEFDKMYKHFEIDADDIVVASSGNSYAKVAVVRKKDLPLVMNTSVIRFKPLKDLDYHFLLAFLKSSLFKDQIDLLITGGAQPNFGPFHLNKILIKVPPTKEEQIKVANIINDAELEIERLIENLSKYKMLKQGMMQELLTGKIRLI